MSNDQWPTPGQWAELLEQPSTDDEPADRSAPPGYRRCGSKLIPAEPEAGMITELYRRVLQDGGLPSD